MERVVDSISVHINKVHIHMQTLGKLKCNAIGEWTPPVVQIVLENINYRSTNANGDVSVHDHVAIQNLLTC